MPPSPAPRGTVLVVDDDPGVLQMMKFLLRRLSLDSLEAASGEEALALYREKPAAFAVVLLDVTMPGLSGEDTARQLRALGSRHKIILMSGYGASEAERRCAEIGADDFLQKPFHLTDLAEVMARHLA